MAATAGHSLLHPGDSRWVAVNRAQDALDAARWRALTIVQRLDRGVLLSQTAAELRRAAWEAQRGRPTG